MAVTRRGYIFGAFLSSVLCVLLIVVSVASDSWVASSATAEGQFSDSWIQYGLFRGDIILRLFATPTSNTLYMTCVAEQNACAVSCKTNKAARRKEVEALALRLTPNPTCHAVTIVDDIDIFPSPPVISFAFYVSLLIILFLLLLFAVVSAVLAIVNATRNPTEPIWGLPGCLWSNVITAVLGLTVLLLFGIYFTSSGLNEHMAVTFVALGLFTTNAGLGYSYWLLIGATICSILNVGLIQLRSYLLERDPPPWLMTSKVESNSDGTILY